MVMITVAPPVILALIGLVYAMHRAYLIHKVRRLVFLLFFFTALPTLFLSMQVSTHSQPITHAL